MPNEKTTIEHTLGAGKANLLALLIVIPVIAVSILLYTLMWDIERFNIGKDAFMDNFLWILVAGIVVHELLHGITWACYAKKGIKSIRFGVMWKFLTPYCHCKEPLKVKHYKIGGAMPLIVMGIIPTIIGLITGHGGILCYGMLFTFAAGGDIIALWMLRKLNSEEYVSDHPKKMGFIQEISDHADTSEIKK